MLWLSFQLLGELLKYELPTNAAVSWVEAVVISALRTFKEKIASSVFTVSALEDTLTKRYA